MGTTMKIKLLPSWGCADVIVLSLFSVYITLVFFRVEFWDCKWRFYKWDNAWTLILPTCSITFDWDRFYEI